MIAGTSRTLIATGCFIGLALAACSRQGPDEMNWARAALERNSRLEIKATDAQSRTFTVLIKDTGEMRVVRADQLVGGPPADAPATPPAPAPAPSAAEASPSMSASPAAASGEAATAAPEAPAPAQPAATPFASRAQRAGGAAPAVPGQVLEAGPGYTIAAGTAQSSAGAAREPGPGGVAERRHDPIICQGARLLHIDNQNLQFDGDGLSAEDGCEIHITNSRIRATGVGVSARAANVHIDNSLIEGDTASIDASQGAQIYTASSKFHGLSRQLDTASVHDLGGNVWN